MKSEIAAYIAGIIDGEGSIYLERFKSKRSTTSLRRNLTPWQYRIVVCLVMCDKPTMRFIANVTERNMQTKKLPIRHSTGFRRKLVAYVIMWRNKFAADLLCSITPYLHCKKRKAILALRFQNRYAPGRGRPFQKHLIPTYEALRKRISTA